MRGSKRIAMYLVALAGLGLCFMIYYITFVANRFVGMEIINTEKYDEMVESNENAGVIPALTYQNQQLCYDREKNTYYMSQSLDTQEWEGKLQVQGCHIYILDDPMMKEKQAAIENAHEFQVLVALDSGISTFKLVFSGMPSIRVDILDKYETADGEESYGTITIFDFTTGGRKVQTAYCTWHPRGNTALRYAKKGYKVNLYEEDGESKKLSLLGLRGDNDWILNALYTDSSKIREKLSLDIWKIISDSNPDVNETGSRMEYVEVFIADEYRGLYGLQEPLDAKQLDLVEEDILYKCSRDCDIPSSYEIANATTNVVGSVEMVYPKVAENALWKPLSEFVFLFSEEQILSGDGYENVYFHTNLSNIGDRQIFDQLIYHMDGRLKNEYFIVKDDGNDYQLLFIPWDFNLTFGDCWTEDTVTNTYFSLERSSQLIDNARNSLWKYYDAYLSEEYYDYLEVRWAELQTLGLTTDELLRRARGYVDYLVESGALERDAAKWPECENSADLSEIEVYLSVKVPSLTEYIESRGMWPIEQ